MADKMANSQTQKSCHLAVIKDGTSPSKMANRYREKMAFTGCSQRARERHDETHGFGGSDGYGNHHGGAEDTLRQGP